MTDNARRVEELWMLNILIYMIDNARRVEELRAKHPSSQVTS